MSSHNSKRRFSPAGLLLLAVLLAAGIFFARSSHREKNMTHEASLPSTLGIPPASPVASASPQVPDSPPSETVPVSPVRPSPREEPPSFRLSSMAGGWGDNDSVGIADRKTGQGHSLKIGYKTTDGWKLTAIDFDRETATFEKAGQLFVAALEEGESITPSPLPSASTPAGPAPTVSAPAEIKEVNLSVPFSNRVFRTEGGEEVAVRRVEHSPKVVEVQTEGKRFAIRRSIAERILALDNLSQDDRLWMMISYPGLVELLPGEDAAAQSNLAEEQLAEMLTPPTNKPPIEELDLLLKNFVEPPPPPETP